MEYSSFFLTIILIAEIVVLVLLLKMDIFRTISVLRDMIQGLDPDSPQDRDYVKFVQQKISYYQVFQIYVYVFWAFDIIAQ